MKILFLVLLFFAPIAHGATWYVDNSLVTGANNGTSWANAWHALSFSGLAAGDTVYISGGPTGNTQTYNLSGELNLVSGWGYGSAGNPITYKIGQDSAHNGTAIFHRTTNGSQFLFCGNYYIFSGDAGDGARHFKLNNYSTLLTLNSSTNVRVSYVDCGDCGGFGSINPGTNIELDHCYLYSTNMSLDHGLFALINQGTAYDQSLFHDNVVNVPYTTGGAGADAFQIVGSGGWSLYNNTITGFSGGGINHQDGWQGSGGSYIKIYNNRITDMQNYSLFPEGFTVGNTYSHMRIYNNVCILTSATSQSTSQQAIAISGSSSFPITDVVCANNVVDGYTLGNPYTFRYPGGSAPSAFINCVFSNNLSVNGGSNIVDPAVTAATNASVTSGNAPTDFTSWTSGSGSNVYTLLAGASTLIHTGTNVSSYIGTLDKDGVTYANPPSIGPYEYVVGGGGLPTSGPKARLRRGANF